MRLVMLFGLLLLIKLAIAQDFDIYPKQQDDKVKLPVLHESVSLNEFRLLSREVRMMDMAYAAIIPGYVHFKAQEKSKAYTLLTLRSMAYVSIGAVYFSAKSKGSALGSYWYDTGDQLGKIQINDNYSINVGDAVLVGAAIVIVGTYLYDWIHGKYLLEKKQEQIRYKYAVKFKLEQTFQNKNTMSFATGIQFSIQF
ncbi:MAG: hypothetical protein JXR60_07380 [Bacteroidales bacterium]|nr:hypothetical protein [Bacteroidales bacterium]